MAHVVTEACHDCSDRPCVAVCPNDCFHLGEGMLYIHPACCIDCAACVPACPSRAIYHERELPVHAKPFRDLNVTMACQSTQLRRGSNQLEPSRF